MSNPAKKTKITELPDEHLYLERLPASPYYEKSIMHRDLVSHVLCTEEGLFVTGSIDGFLKFWRRPTLEIGSVAAAAAATKLSRERPAALESLKVFKAHTGPICGMTFTKKGDLLASVGADRTLKVFDCRTLDILLMKRLDYLPETCAWLSDGRHLLISSRQNNKLFLYSPLDPDSKAQTFTLEKTATKLAMCPETAWMVVALQDGTLLVIDTKLLLETNESLLSECVSSHQFDDLKKAQTQVVALAPHPNGQSIAALGADGFLRIFKFSTRKLYKKYDESSSFYRRLLLSKIEASPLEEEEEEKEEEKEEEEKEKSKPFTDANKKLESESERIGKLINREEEFTTSLQGQQIGLAFDESGNFLILSCPLGIKVLNIVTNRVSRIIGKGDASSTRFLNFCLFQSRSQLQGLSLDMAAAENPMLQRYSAATISIILLATAWGQPRFYIFSNYLIETAIEGRDLHNERTAADLAAAAIAKAAKETKTLPTGAILRTTKGDIHITLYPQYAPLAVENFVGHARAGYYDGIIFHRIIRGFMIQTGDPKGDGTGGQSIWGDSFKDEFHLDLRHDQPFTVSMANSGRNTNGSQFFITVAKCPWLDDKHTVFGRVFKGQEVVKKIETTDTDKLDRPKQDVKILQIDIVK